MIWLNKIKDHKDKVYTVELLRDTVKHKIQSNPLMVVLLMYGLDKAKEKHPFLFEIQQKEDKDFVSIEDAFNNAYRFKEGKGYSDSYLNDLKSIKNRFIDFVEDSKKSITTLNQKMCVDFLEHTTKGKTKRTYNNTRSYISAYLTEFKKKQYISENFMQNVETLRTKPTKNRAYTQRQLKKLWELLEDNLPLKFFCMHVYYGLMREATIIRLKCSDIDLEENIFNTDTKTGKFDKIITERLRSVYDTLDLTDNDKYIFGYSGLIEDWQANDKTRKDTYSKMFRPYKEQLGIKKEDLRYYGIYSLRHNGIANLYNGFVQENKKQGITDYVDHACRQIMPFTNHKNIEQVKAYLREINPRIRFDYGKYMK